MYDKNKELINNGYIHQTNEIKKEEINENHKDDSNFFIIKKNFFFKKNSIENNDFMEIKEEIPRITNIRPVWDGFHQRNMQIKVQFLKNVFLKNFEGIYKLDKLLSIRKKY